MNNSLAARAFLACSLVCFLLCSRVEGASVSLAWDPSPSPSVVGYAVYYGLVSEIYTETADAGMNWSMTVDGLDDGVTYFFTVRAYDGDGVESVNSDEISVTIDTSTVGSIASTNSGESSVTNSASNDDGLGSTNSTEGSVTNGVGNDGPTVSSNSPDSSVTIPYPPLIIFEPSSQTAQAGAAVSLLVDAVGTPPVTFQWYDNGELVSGGTNSLLSLPQISDANAGDYTVVVTDSGGSVTSDVAVVTVVDSPSRLNAMSGDLGTLLRGASAPLGGKLLAVLSAPNLIAPTASAAGTYNGLFYPTNDWGAPEITLQTAGILCNCVVDSQGDYSGTIYLAGLSNSISGTFDAAGNGSAILDRASTGLSDLGVALHLNLTPGTFQISGLVSNLDQGDPWTAVLMAEMETNAFALSPDFLILIPSVNGWGAVTGVESGGVISLGGMLGDGTAISQIAPVSSDGNLPLFIQLYENGGLLAGWVNIFGSPSTCMLTWICPSGPATAGFTNVIEAAVTSELAPGP